MSSQSSANGLGLDDAERAWDVLAGKVEALIGAWEKGDEPPRLGDYVPDGPNALRRLALVELIKVDLEYRWLHRSAPRRVEQYVEQFPELGGGRLPSDLLYEEFHIRKQAGEAVEPKEYYERFPEQADELGRLLGLESAHQTTTLFGAEKPKELEVGDELEDFDLLARLGKGAFASVFMARQRSMQRLVALKVSADRGSEPQTLAQLDHDHIVRVFDQRVLDDRGLRLLYMQYVPGGTLHPIPTVLRKVPVGERTGRVLLHAVDKALENRGESAPAESAVRDRLARTSWAEVVCWLGARLASALDYAHRRGILHRDVKPANVLLTGEGVPKLADFNISFCSKLDGASPAAYFGGSLAYMSPEQLEACNPRHERRPDSLDGRSDIYSLGVLLWELLTGNRPFPDEQMESGWAATLAQMAERRRGGVPAEATAQIPRDCPPGLERVLLCCLAPDPSERYQTGAELARQLELCLQPRTQKLLRPPAHSWRRMVRRLPVPILLIAALIPNILAALFNFAYNRQEIVDRLHETREGLQLESAREVFWNIQMIVNGLAFPLGLALVAFLMWPVARGLARLRAGKVTEALDLRALRRRCLLLGQRIALISMIEWAIAGVAYPLSLHAAVGSMTLAAYAHFLTSLVLCGVIAGTYPFFAVTFLSVRALYPNLVSAETISSEDTQDIVGLGKLSWMYLVLAACLPMLAITLLVVSGSGNRFALGVLGAGGLVGFGAAFWLQRSIQSDLAALIPAVLPPGDTAESARDLLDSFWSGSRM